MLLANNFNEAYDAVRAQVEDLQRQISAGLMAGFPDRDFFSQTAESLRVVLGSESVEVNVLLAGKQITIVSQPSGTIINVAVPDRESLCVLTVGADVPLAVSNISDSPIATTHPAKGVWEAWASAPVRINGHSAGTICALEVDPREWTEDEELELRKAARVIAKRVEEWAKSPIKE